MISESLVSSDILLLIFWWLNWDNLLIVKILGLIFGPVETFELLRLDNCEITYEVLLTFDFKTERELACSMSVFGIFSIGVYTWIIRCMSLC